MKKHIPNLITLGNLACGTLAVIYAVQGDFITTASLVVLGILLDFFDGFAARLLHVQGELGKELDSLADMVTSGVVPGIVMLKLIEESLPSNSIGYFGWENDVTFSDNLPLLAILLTLGAGYRLAKFNIDTRQTDSFLGLPTPAMNLFVVVLPLIIHFEPNSWLSILLAKTWFLITVVVVFTVLMNVDLPLFSLKFKGFSWKKNLVQYVFLFLSLVLLLIFNFVAVPVIILLYVAISIVQFALKK